MKDVNRTKHIQIRLTEAEVKKYKKVSASNGLTETVFTRYSIARASVIFSAVNQELIQIAHQKGMVLNEYHNILLVNKIL
jgi:hypothetical protein